MKVETIYDFFLVIAAFSKCDFEGGGFGGGILFQFTQVEIMVVVGELN